MEPYTINDRTRELARTALRVVAGAAFFSHGGQKIFGWFGGFGEAGTAEIASAYGIAGVIEVVAGACIVLGLFTRAAAFVASGEMAVAYFWKHWASSGEMWWWDNRGELVMIFSFLWLFFAVWGAGPFSLDGWLARRREGRSTG